MIIRLTLSIVCAMAIPASWAGDAMPVAQQNLLVRKYCAACHDDVKMVAFFSLQHYDAANPDPGLTAMLLSKMKDGAFGAAGIPVPDKPTKDALLSALSEKAVVAGNWYTTIQSPVTTAGIVRESGALYRLTLSCNADTHQGEMRVAWSPKDVPGTGGTLAAVIDGEAPLKYEVANGEGRAILRATRLPDHNLTVSDLFPGETVTFPFAELTSNARQSLSACFNPPLTTP